MLQSYGQFEEYAKPLIEAARNGLGEHAPGTTAFYALHQIRPDLAVRIITEWGDPRGRDELVDGFLGKAKLWWHEPTKPVEVFTFVEAIRLEPSGNPQRPAE